MTEREALLHAVFEHPDDDTPRLVFADWLQEHGEEDRAEFIRVQIALARGSTDPALAKRETEFLGTHGEKWSEPLLDIGLKFWWRENTLRSINGIEYRRGFAYGLQLDEREEAFSDRAAELFRRAPIQRIAFYHLMEYWQLSECPELFRLREMSLNDSEFDTKTLQVLFGSEYLKQINHFELNAGDDYRDLAPDGVELLSKTRSLPALKHLTLEWNWFVWENDADWIEALLKGNLVGRLESLWLQRTILQDAGVEALVRSEQIRALRRLNLSRNRIGERGLRALATSRNLESLEVLDLRENMYDAYIDGPEEEIGGEMRQLLQERFGTGLLLDGDAEPDPLR